MYLGIEESTGLVYEGSGNPDIPAIPLPTITQAVLIETEHDWARLPAGIVTDPMRWAFREASFDPVTRVRRGTLYQPLGTQPSDQSVLRHPYDDPMRVAIGGPDYRQRKRLYVYTSCFDLLQRPRRGEGDILALGTSQAASAWLILQTEVLANRAVMVTLKALSTFGVLPALDETKAPAGSQTIIKESFEKVLNSATRESPSSVVEHCRDALQVFLSRWLVAHGAAAQSQKKELAKLAPEIEGAPHSLVCVGNLARIVARLHGRGKSNERHEQGSRDLLDEDAQLAVGAVGFTLREFGWTKP